ncbi:MAG: NADH:flavin oxidoreductase/NADH oxidase [Spirochaetaceae bacterium]|nr:MAG: NADH:flavin oxidoreductase/NADH oxidase [Spirochaetaceae bacterium]
MFSIAHSAENPAGGIPTQAARFASRTDWCILWSMRYPLLLSPLSIGRFQAPNRIVMPPMVIWKAGLDGLVTDDHVKHYAHSAGPGVCIVEATAVSPEGRLAATQLGVWSDNHTEGLSRLAAVIKRSGALAGIQIHHAGGKTTAQKNGGLPIWVPSRLGGAGQQVKELDQSEIERIIADFGAAARRCAAAGFDLIELHGAHGYLGSQFLAPSTNHRTDRWGGSIENRSRFVAECVRAAQHAVAAALHKPIVSVRLGVADAGRPPLDAAEGVAAAEIVCRAGAQLLHVSHAGSMPGDGSGQPWSATLQLAGQTRRRVNVPLIGVGGISSPAEAEKALQEPLADMIAVGRALLADPAWAAKTIAGKEQDIYRCIDCKPRCFHFKQPHKCPARRAAAASGS